jgi:hypothetical protein
MSESATPAQAWAACLDVLKRADALPALSWAPDDPQLQAEIYRQVLMDLALAYFVYFQSDPDHPEFAPFLNSVFLLQPNPDDTYFYAPVDGRGTYRLSGERGSVRILTLTIGDAMIGMTETPGRQLAEYDLARFGVEPDQEVDILLSADQPAGHKGLWLKLDPAANFLLVRQRSYDWGGERAARLAIERLDADPAKPRLSTADTEAKLVKAAEFAERLTRQWLHYQNRIKAAHPANEVHFTGFSEFGGVKVQVYWEAIFEIPEGRALVLETEVPDHAPYWNVQLNDQIWNTLEYVYRQSSLNGSQARLDRDGKFRAVICPEDPGVPNWLDTVGRRQGTLVGRWYATDTHPMPRLTLVPLEEVRDHLPSDTPHVDASARAEAVRARSRGAQLRRRW